MEIMMNSYKDYQDALAKSEGYTLEVWAYSPPEERRCDGRPLLIKPDADLTEVVHAWNMVEQGYYSVPGWVFVFET